MSIVAPNLFQRIAVSGNPAMGFPSPLQFPGLELYLNSKLGIVGADGDRIDPIPDQSGHTRNAISQGQFAAVLRKSVGTGASPNGSQTLQFDGFDPPFSQWYHSALPNPWPSLNPGYTFYWIANFRLPSSSSGQQLLWEEDGSGRLRIVPKGSGSFENYRDEINDKLTTQAFQTGWQTGRFVIHGPSVGTADMYLNGNQLAWAGANTVQLNTAISSGYVLAQLGANTIVGMSMFFGAFAWFSRVHDLATQKLLDNYFRLQFGLALL